jgi:FKBP-type peptidyl-prolyl cis-trans isomerase
MENKKNMNIVLAVIICLVLAGVLIFISLKNKVNMPSNNNIGDVTNNQPISPDNNTTNPVASAPATTPTTADTTAPAGTVAKTGDTVAMNYTGRLADGTVFDSNVDPKFGHVTPFVFTLGAGQVIPGWDKGIVGMKVGEKKTLVIPPADGYGVAGMPPTIPANATLTFDVELLAIKK